MGCYVTLATTWSCLQSCGHCPRPATTSNCVAILLTACGSCMLSYCQSGAKIVLATLCLRGPSATLTHGCLKVQG